MSAQNLSTGSLFKKIYKRKEIKTKREGKKGTGKCFKVKCLKKCLNKKNKF